MTARKQTARTRAAQPGTERVDFTAQVADLPPDLRERLRVELDRLFPAERCERILVSRRFGGYSENLAERVVLGIELRTPQGYATHVVKIGKRSEIEPDAAGWRACTHDRQVASRILAPVEELDGLADDRAAVLYRDAYVLFGLSDDANRPVSLETAAAWAVRDDGPAPLSVERALAQIYTDLGRWFFPGATADRARAGTFYRRRLRFGMGGKDILTLWREHPQRTQLRRDAIWLICGVDPPDADPVRKPARYLDPVDLVAWMTEAGHEERLPETLVGRSHGDLHGRNVLVGVRRGEVEYPAVFDYGDMGPQNVLAWDFAKLETELKVRLLVSLLADGEVRAWFAAKDPRQAKAWQTGHARPQRQGLPSKEHERAARIKAFLVFEEWLHTLTDRLLSRAQVESLAPLPEDLHTGSEKLDRLASILLRVRKEAALWLGFERHGRNDKWRDELYFALAVYGLLNVRWNYEEPQAESALISAGVAAARMPTTPQLLQRAIDGFDKSSDRFPSYRVPLFVVHRLWRDGKNVAGQTIIKRTVFEAESSGGSKTRLNVRPEWSHAVPLIAEGTLVAMELDESKLVEEILRALRAPAREFDDYETLGRIGRLFKEAGDRLWKDSNLHAKTPEHGAAQMYAKACTVYEEAFLATGDYYTGINAATLALLTKNGDAARRFAQQVADICSRMRDIPIDERFWIFATEGEAALILQNWVGGAQFYRDALASLEPGQGGMADSAYGQLCRLWRILGDNVEASLRVFEESQFRDDLKPLFGRIMVQPELPTNTE